MLKTFFLNSNNALYGEEEFNYIQKFLLQQGILNTQGADYNDFIDLKVTQNGAGDMSVNVGLGTAVLNTTRSSVSFKVFISNLASANLAVTNNTSGSNRVDAVILKLARLVEPDALMSNVATLQVVAGSGVSALTDNAIQTAIGADYDFIRLADITVADSATQILTASIADTRVRCYTTDATVSNPTIIKFRQLTADPSVPLEGEMWYNTTDNILRYYDGATIINIQASVYTGGNGIDVTAGVISAKLATGGGLEFSGGAIKRVVKFSGTGADGALTISSGTTTIDLAGASVVTKNYTSISITGTGKLAFINPHANGTSIILKCTGNVTITSSTVPAIECSLLGGSAQQDGKGIFGRTGGGTRTSYGKCFGINQNIYALGLDPALVLIPGAGGGNYTGTGGGKGGGALLITCDGALNITSTIYAKGGDGVYESESQSPTKTGAGAGASVMNDGGAGSTFGGDPYGAGTGGGGGGMIVILYKTLTANTATLNVNGGAASTGSGAGGLGFAHIGAYSAID